MPLRRSGNALRAALALASVSLGLASCSSPFSHSSSPQNTLPAVLAPAIVRPVVPECSTPLTHTQDGNVTPLTCKNGDINVPAWKFYAPLSSEVMALGAHMGVEIVLHTMCSDVKVHHATRVEEVRGAQLASDYYGWGMNQAVTAFVVSPTSGC